MTASHMESHVTDKLYQPYDHDHDSLSYGEPCHWQALSTIRSRPWRPLIWRAMSLTSFINHTITTMTASHMESHVTDKLYQPYDHDHDGLSYGEPCHWQALSHKIVRVHLVMCGNYAFSFKCQFELKHHEVKFWSVLRSPYYSSGSQKSWPRLLHSSLISLYCSYCWICSRPE